MKLQKLSENFTVTGQLSPADLAEVKAAGFSTVICNRPDGEEFGQPSAEIIGAACVDHALNFRYVPMSPAGPGPQTLADFSAAVAGAEGRVLAYCRSGARSAMLFNATR